METDRYARYGAAAGIVWVALLIIGFFIVFPNPPDFDAPAGDWSRYYIDNRSDIQVGNSILVVGLFFYVWWLGSLRSGLRAAEGGTGRLSNIAFGAGVGSLGFGLIAISAGYAAALRPELTAPQLTRSLNDLGVVAGGAAAGIFAALFIATAVAALRFGGLPAWVGWVSAVCGVAQFLAIGTAVTDSGAFSFDGFLGGFLPVITFVVGILAISIALVREPGPAARPAAAAPPAA